MDFGQADHGIAVLKQLSGYEQLTTIVTFNPGVMRWSFAKLAENLP
jgi:hypothetical protein